MVRIAFILLCHKDPDAVIEQARLLTAAGDCLAIHFDARARPEAFSRIKAALADNPDVVFAKRRLKCGWGAWSLVAATLEALEAAAAAFPDATHFYMVSGDCMPIKSAAHTHAHLARRDVDHIESFDFYDSDWIKTGIKEERLLYRHVFNERRQKRLFYAALALQRWLGLRRAIPSDLEVMIGSQWWCLRRQTIESILRFCRSRPDIVRFFRTTWIPDETFFQTLVRHLVPEREIENRTLTFLMFSDYGMPVTFYNDHYTLLLTQDFLFARKISPEALRLRKQLAALFTAGERSFDVSNEGRALHAFLTQRGREGRRFAPRFWEDNGPPDRAREILIVVCKKWHVAKRLVARIAEAAQLPTLDYLFDEESCTLPDLGGIQSGMAKRHRHRRALLGMLFDYFDTEKLVICLDTANLDLLRDVHGDHGVTRVLDVGCRFSDGDLEGHARRVGLAGAATPRAAVARLLPTLRRDIQWERDALRAAGLPHHHHFCETLSPRANARALAGFLGVSKDMAQAIAETPDLFSD